MCIIRFSLVCVLVFILNISLAAPLSLIIRVDHSFDVLLWYVNSTRPLRCHGRHVG